MLIRFSMAHLNAYWLPLFLSIATATNGAKVPFISGRGLWFNTTTLCSLPLLIHPCSSPILFPFYFFFCFVFFDIQISLFSFTSCFFLFFCFFCIFLFLLMYFPISPQILVPFPKTREEEKRKPLFIFI